MNLPTIIVGLIFGVIFFLATRKSIRNLRAGKCEGCSCSCAQKNNNIKQFDKSKILL